MNRQSIKETLIITGFFLGIFLSLRFIFYTYLSTQWFGMLGVTTAITLPIYYLSLKNKFGVLGPMFLRRIIKRTKGKLGIGLIVINIIMIYFSGLMVYGMTYADQQGTNEAVNILHSQNITNIQTLTTHQTKFTTSQEIAATIILLTPNQLNFIVTKTINELSGNIFLPIFSIFLAEEIEGLGLLLLFRYKKLNLEVTKEKAN